MNKYEEFEKERRQIINVMIKTNDLIAALEPTVSSQAVMCVFAECIGIIGKKCGMGLKDTLHFTSKTIESQYEDE